MGKWVRARVKGKSRRFRFPDHRALGDPVYWEGKVKVVDIVHAPERSAPLALVKKKDGQKMWVLPPEGIKTGQWLRAGEGKIRQGNVFTLSEIPEGIPIFNIEGDPGDNGRYARASGNFATIMTKEESRCTVKLPSKKVRTFSPFCRAMIGVVAGGGRVDKPFLKAGKKWYHMRSKGKLYPFSSGSRMNPLDHPFGGKTRPGWPKTSKRDAPAGAKVGSIAARRTGRRN